MPVSKNPRINNLERLQVYFRIDPNIEMRVTHGEALDLEHVNNKMLIPVSKQFTQF
jgi:hypothetical protein